MYQHRFKSPTVTHLRGKSAAEILASVQSSKTAVIKIANSKTEFGIL